VVDTAGVGDGVPDLCVWPRLSPDKALVDIVVLGGVRDPTAVWLELKVGKGKERKSQLAWRASAEARGIRVATVRTLQEALAVLP
jgi:hypothetical protein